MKSLPEVQQIVMDYATTTPVFISPTTIDDAINPAPSTLNPAQFNSFFSSLYAFLATHAVQTHIRLEELSTMSTWAELAGILFARQTA